MSQGIFISYRRADTSGFAGRLFDRLVESFPRDQLFIDVESIEPGENFAEVLSERVGDCSVLLVLIGPRWLATGPDGTGRTLDSKDFVRIEVEAAVARGVRVIPLLIDGAQLPAAEELPESMQGLVLRQALEISHRRFEGDVDALLQVLRRVVTSPHSAAPSSAPSLPLPEKPSIAILAFKNLSGDPEQEYFADGISEDLIAALSRTSGLFVIARNSSFSFKHRPLGVRQIGEELGVRYVLEGSVRKSAERLRITVQLLECASECHLWAGKFDGTLADLFDLQDEITVAVVGAVQPSIRHAEIQRSIQKKPG